MYPRLMSEKQKFSRVSQNDDQETLLPAHVIREEILRKENSRRIGRVIFLFLGFICIFSLGVGLGRYLSFPTDNECATRTTQYSPILKDVGIKYTINRFNGSLLKENVFRLPGGHGSPVDAAWEALGVDYRPLIVPESEAPASGLLHDQVHINKKYGGGYLANVEGLHQLHCLNLVRKSLYYNYEYYHDLQKGPFSNSDSILHLHVSHCLDIIRQQLMCTLDTGLLGQIWFNPKSPEAFVDFNTNHKCKNFEEIREWARVRQAPAETEMDYLSPPEPSDKIYEGIP